MNDAATPVVLRSTVMLQREVFVPSFAWSALQTLRYTAIEWRVRFCGR